MAEVFGATLLLPVAETILINLWTGAPAGQG